MSARAKLLFLSHTLPFPPDGGVNIRTWHTYRLLAQAFDVTALCFYRRQHRPTPADVERGLEGMRRYGRAEAFAIPQEWSRARLLRDHATSVLTGRAYTILAYEDAAYRRRVAEELSRCDIVHVDSLDLAGYLPLVRQAGKPVVCSHHNVESTLLRRRAATEGSAARRAYLMHQAGLYDRVERAWCPRLSLNLACSPNDAEEFRQLAPGAPFTVVPNGVDVGYFTPSAGTRGIVFVGGLDWFPNRDALQYFADEIRPRLDPALAQPVHFVGRAGEADRAAFRAKGIELTGHVPDIRPFVAEAACFIVPLRSGGGTRLKVLDAWSMGKAIVSTSVGCEGLATRDGENILIRDDAAGFADAITDLLRDAALRERLGAAGRQTVVDTYAWEIIGRDLVGRYESLLRGSNSSGSSRRAES